MAELQLRSSMEPVISGFASEGDRDNLHMHIPEAQKIIQDGTDRVREMNLQEVCV